MIHTIHMRVRVVGRVQGVGFRAWTRDQEVFRGLTGWVRNEPDGAVTAELHGPGHVVSEMIEEMRGGPPYARVAEVFTEAEALPPEPPVGFAILR